MAGAFLPAPDLFETSPALRGTASLGKLIKLPCEILLLAPGRLPGARRWAACSHALRGRNPTGHKSLKKIHGVETSYWAVRAFDGQNSLRNRRPRRPEISLCPPEPSRLTLPKRTLPFRTCQRAILRVTPSKPLPERQRTPATALCSSPIHHGP